MYRYEKSGVVHGLTRARGFTQDDAHIYCTMDQMPGELDRLLTFVLDLLKDYGLTTSIWSCRPGTRRRASATDEDWAQATETLRAAAEAQGLELVMDEAGGLLRPEDLGAGQGRDRAHLADVHHPGRLPAAAAVRPGVPGPDGTRQRPVMIHRALFGSIERFFAVLLEHYAGAFPPWLAPVTVVGIPVADHHIEYLQAVVERLRKAGVRAEVDTGSDRMQKKIRTAQKQKVPYMLIVGDDDVAKGAGELPLP